jgi:hypothetical protein
MTERPDDDTLDHLLREDARREGRLPDEAAFEARVLASLPAPRSPRATWWKPMLVLGSAALGSALALAFAPGDSSLLAGFADLVQHRYTPAAIAGIATSFALLAAAIVIAAETD